MSTKELKASIYQLLEQTEDNVVLEDIREYISQRKEGIIPELGCTPDEYNRELEEGDAAIQRGEYYTQEEVFSYIDQKLAALRHETKVE